MYFQIPLMVLVILPSLEGLRRPAWREAASNLGASSWQYWRYVGGPVLMPAFLGCVLLLFGSALSAYATAQALTSGSIPLTSIQIGSFLNGNVLAGQTNVGKALALAMVVIIAIAMSAVRARSSEGRRNGCSSRGQQLAGRAMAPEVPPRVRRPAPSDRFPYWRWIHPGSSPGSYFALPLYAELPVRWHTPRSRR